MKFSVIEFFVVIIMWRETLPNVAAPLWNPLRGRPAISLLFQSYWAENSQLIGLLDCKFLKLIGFWAENSQNLLVAGLKILRVDWLAG